MNIYNKLTCTYPRQAVSSFGHSLRCHQVQEEEPHLQREAHRGDHVPVPGALRGPQEVPRGQGGAVPVQEHVPEHQRGLAGLRGPGLPQHGREEDGVRQAGERGQCRGNICREIRTHLHLLPAIQLNLLPMTSLKLMAISNVWKLKNGNV